MRSSEDVSGKDRPAARPLEAAHEMTPNTCERNLTETFDEGE